MKNVASFILLLLIAVPYYWNIQSVNVKDGYSSNTYTATVTSVPVKIICIFAEDNKLPDTSYYQEISVYSEYWDGVIHFAGATIKKCEVRKAMDADDVNMFAPGELNRQ